MKNYSQSRKRARANAAVRKVISEINKEGAQDGQEAVSPADFRKIKAILADVDENDSESILDALVRISCLLRR